MLGDHDAGAVLSPARDAVSGVDATDPHIVSISDIHGFLGDARRALLTLADHPAYPPIVETDAARRLHWVGGDGYVLVFNGDLIDRGAHSSEVVSMVERLIQQAPPGHVRVTLGNHEMGILTPDRFGWMNWYSVERTDDERRTFAEQILDGHVVAAYDGYHVTYAHAGATEPYEVSTVNSELISGVDRLYDVIGTADDVGMQHTVIEEYPTVFGVAGTTGRGPDAGLAWLDFEFMPEDAPPQIVGHTRHDEPTRKGAVICQNVIRNNRRRAGGEGVMVETPEKLVFLRRDGDGGVEELEFPIPE